MKTYEELRDDLEAISDELADQMTIISELSEIELTGLAQELIRTATHSNRPILTAWIREAKANYEEKYSAAFVTAGWDEADFWAECDRRIEANHQGGSSMMMG